MTWTRTGSRTTPAGVAQPPGPTQPQPQPQPQRKSFGNLVRLVRASLALVWSSGPRLFLGLLALQAMVAGALAGQILAVQHLLTAILEVADDAQAISEIVAPVLLLAGLTALTSIAGGLQGHLQRVLGENVARAMWRRVLDVATAVDLRHFESSDFHNQLERVQSSALTRPYQVSQGLITLVGSLLAGIGVGVALAGISPLLLPLLVVGGLPLLLTSRQESRLEFAFAVSQTPTLRLRTYLTLLQTGRDEAKEVRAFGLAPWLRGRFDAVYEEYLAELSTHVRRRSRLTAVGNIGSAVVLAAILLVLVWLIGEGAVGVAGAGAAIVAIRMLASQVQGVFGGVRQIFESGLFLADLDVFLALGAAQTPPEARGPAAPTSFGSITARDLVFTYPGAAAPALDGVSIDLRAGEVIALVGENGSGKTTLAKVLAGLYDPDAGAVAWDGSDLREFDRGSLRARITVVFQDFVQYALTATQNIAVGRADDPVDPERVQAAARAAGADRFLAGLPHGYDTILSRLFVGGQELSGGQWQRVALARAFYRDAPLMILDEPSASLDPRAEHELFANLRTVLGGRTALFISHRFSTVRGADRIYVLKEGRVVEHGTHLELLRRGGHYAELHALQAEAYVAAGEATPSGQ
ncbi:ABC transporter ATP-binding protein [Pengzhenrongella frigida]|uniref:ABC transporter ATP-binding protein n=1 Tax=Pengzhenrongella frigida TaxID=1259133 RepID=A0A4Q5N0K0_9MICO|nr:ABC transporter ATP-binding protein [Cellulomonas sp. HLT2-17]RYV50743.1 ABC transporter ATP-binding protein [Cellulomonas sp. HLT2-17]